jgi:putative transposase
MLGDVFDPTSEVQIHEYCRPHWGQAGAVVFITFRTHDSIPLHVVEQWERDKQDWMASRGHEGKHWSEVLPTLPNAERFAFLKAFNRAREISLDACHGRSPFRQPSLAKIVSDALLYFDGQRYRMGDFVVMPNHVHLLAAFPSADAMRKQYGSWLHFTAVQVNRELGVKGRLWQKEPFDHLVRSPEQYELLRTYIAENPAKAGLKAGEFLYRRWEG